VKGLRLWIGIAVSALCVYLVARRINWQSFLAALGQVRPLWLGAGMLASGASYGVSGLRWRHVISREAALTRREAFDVVAIGNLANLVAPSRAGDLARSALVARWKTVPVSRVLGGIIVERYADVVMLIALAAMLWFAVRFPPVVQAGVLAFVAAGTVAIVAVVVAADRLPAIAGRAIGFVAPSLAARISGFLEGFFAGVRSAGHLDLFAGTLALSAAIWTLAGVAMFCNVAAFALPVPWYAALFVLLVINLGGVIPASPGSIGVYHYLAIIALTVWMSDANRALGFAVVAHATGLLVITLLGLASLASRHESLFRVTA
jgi:glycosyltransferase 2 family protein